MPPVAPTLENIITGLLGLPENQQYFQQFVQLPEIQRIRDSVAPLFVREVKKREPAPLVQTLKTLTALDLEGDDCMLEPLLGPDNATIHHFPTAGQKLFLTNESFEATIANGTFIKKTSSTLTDEDQKVLQALGINGFTNISDSFTVVDCPLSRQKAENLKAKTPYTLSHQGREYTIIGYSSEAQSTEAYAFEKIKRYKDSNIGSFLACFISLDKDPIVLLTRAMLYIAEKTNKPELTKLVDKVAGSVVNALVSVAFIFLSLAIKVSIATISSVAFGSLLAYVFYLVVKPRMGDSLLLNTWDVIKIGSKVLVFAIVSFYATIGLINAVALYRCFISIPQNLFIEIKNSFVEYSAS